MAGVLEYSTTAASNTSINSIGIAGSDAVSNFDNAQRQLLADIATAITRRVTKSTGYTVLKTDHAQLIECTAALTLSLTAAATLTDGFMFIVRANGGAVTIDPASSEPINGTTTVTIADGDAAFVYCNGTAFFTITVPSAIAALTPADGNFIVGDGTTWVAESGSTARMSLGAQAQSSDLDTYAANPLTAAELAELQNIDTTTISATQWGYLGALNQGLTTTSTPTFGTTTINGTLTVTG